MAGGDVATAIEGNQTDKDNNQIESSIVLKQIRRLPSVEPLPSPPPPPAPPAIVVTDDNNELKEPNK
jgi:hypothetical protein